MTSPFTVKIQKSIARTICFHSDVFTLGSNRLNNSDRSSGDYYIWDRQDGKLGTEPTYLLTIISQALFLIITKSSDYWLSWRGKGEYVCGERACVNIVTVKNDEQRRWFCCPWFYSVIALVKEVSGVNSISNNSGFNLMVQVINFGGYLLCQRGK